MPWLIYSEKLVFLETKIEDRSFGDFLQYRFNHWMSTRGISAHATILIIGCLSAVTTGAFAYSLLTGRPPSEGVWLVFMWMSASSVDVESSNETGIVGIGSTIAGLLLLALLLGTVADWFAARVAASKEGRDAVIEGNHVLVLGYSELSKPLLEELAKASDDDMTIVVMGTQGKQQIEHQIQADNVTVGDHVKLVVRSGRLNDADDLARVAANSASRVVIAEDPRQTREESDAQTFGILLTLKAHHMPPEPGWVTAQCCLTRNQSIMHELHQHSVILNGERLGRAMVQSSQDHGLCQIFNDLIGFDGSEFYSRSAVELGFVGCEFWELPFRLPEAVPLGVIQDEGGGECLINPEKGYKVKPDDHLIVLAEDAQSFQSIDAPSLDYAAWKQARADAQHEEEDPNDHETAKVLVCNFHDRGIGCAIMFALDEMCGPGSEVTIYTGMTAEECQHVLETAQQRQGTRFKHIACKVVHVAPHHMTSGHHIEALDLKQYQHIFVLADFETLSYAMADQRSVAMVIQMKSITRKLGCEFNPVVEVCSDTAAAQLKQCGITNSVNVNVILLKAVAMVALSRVAHFVLEDLLSADGNNLDIQQLKDYMAEGETVPDELSFAEATAFVTRGAQQILVGWSDCSEGSHDPVWLVNPADKLAKRKWTLHDRLVVIKDV